jgi:hypothetical protein
MQGKKSSIIRLTSDERERLHAEAHEALDRGWVLIPIFVGAKSPMIDWGHIRHGPWPTLDVLDEWFEKGIVTKRGFKRSDFNLAVATGERSRIVIVDCDNDDALRIANEMGLRSPVRLKTPRGHHLYFEWRGLQANRAAINDVIGLDLRGDGGYALIAGSVAERDGVRACYQWAIEPGHDLDDMPTWHPIAEPERNIDATAPESLVSDEIIPDLTTTHLSAIERLRALKARRGRGMVEGEGRNAETYKLVCALLARGVVEPSQIYVDLQAWMDEVFDDQLSSAELEKLIFAAIASDKKRNPQRYIDQAAEMGAADEVPERALITPRDIMRSRNIERRVLIDPLISEGEIVQLYGYSGHGKSSIVAAATYAAAAGVDFGPFTIDTPVKTLYIDLENSIDTLRERFEYLVNEFGDTHDNIHFDIGGQDCESRLNLNSVQGQQQLNAMLSKRKVDLLVIDTVRSSLVDFNEKDSAAWTGVNRFLKKLRDKHGIAILLVHHANKPSMGQTGSWIMGTEAGSAAQLTDLDRQIRVTYIARTKGQAFAKRAEQDEGVWEMYKAMLRVPAEDSVAVCWRIDWEKVRQPTPQHEIPLQLALAAGENGEYFLHIPSLRQRVQTLHDQGHKVREIAAMLRDADKQIDLSGSHLWDDAVHVPYKWIRRWTGDYSDIPPIASRARALL